MKIHNITWCNAYSEPALPDEDGKCSLCGAALYELQDFKIKSAWLFPLGQLLATPGALITAKKHGISLSQLIERHISGDWGELSQEDKESNEQSLAEHNGRLFSAYGTGKSKLWIITEADLSATTILTPSEY